MRGRRHTCTCTRATWCKKRMNVFVVAMGLTRDKIRDTHVVGVGVIDEYPLLKAEG